MNDFPHPPKTSASEEAYPELWSAAPYRPPEVDQWLQLYQTAEKIAHCQANRVLKNTRALLIRLPQRSEPVFVSLLAEKEANQGWSLTIYPGYQSYAGSPIFNGGAAESSVASLCRFTGLLCRFAPQAPSLPPRLRSLNLYPPNLPAKQKRIYFLCYHAGQTPWPLSAEQAALLIQVLAALPQVLLALRQGKLVLDKEREQMAECFFRPEEQIWDCRAAEAPMIPLAAETITIVDELFIARLKKHKITAAALELDVLYLPLPYDSQAGQPAIYPLACILANHNDQKILEQHLFAGNEDVHSIIVAMLYQYITDQGRPRKIYVRNQSFKYLLTDLCQKLSIGLEAERGMPAVDSFVESIADYLAHGFH